MWLAESERFMCWPRGEDRRESVCQWAARFTNRFHPSFNFNAGMAGYALVYLMDRHEGQTLTTYAQGVVSWWGQQYLTHIYRR